jgi:hypothetical protein
MSGTNATTTINALRVSLGILISNDHVKINQLSISGTNTTTTINALGISLGISIANTNNRVRSNGIISLALFERQNYNPSPQWSSDSLGVVEESGRPSSNFCRTAFFGQYVENTQYTAWIID